MRKNWHQKDGGAGTATVVMLTWGKQHECTGGGGQLGNKAKKVTDHFRRALMERQQHFLNKWILKRTKETWKPSKQQNRWKETVSKLGKQESNRTLGSVGKGLAKDNAEHGEPYIGPGDRGAIF